MRPLLIILAGVGLYAGARATIPFEMTHRLSEGCHWIANPLLDRMGLAQGEPNGDQNLQRAVCMWKAGAKSTLEGPWTIRDKWPTKAEFTAWERVHEGR